MVSTMLENNFKSSYKWQTKNMYLPSNKFLQNTSLWYWVCCFFSDDEGKVIVYTINGDLRPRGFL